MIRLLFFILVTSMLWTPNNSSGEALYSIFIEENARGVAVRVKSARFFEVLQSIQDKTGIRFQVSPSLRIDRVTADFQARDWRAAIRKLLESYRHTETLDPKGGLSEIKVLSRETETNAGKK